MNRLRGRTNMKRSRAALFPLLSLAMVAAALGADTSDPVATGSKPAYAYATNGVKEKIAGRQGDEVKLLLDKSNLGGNELEAAEVTMPAGLQVGSHVHKSVEVIYVLAGVYGHEVN